MPYAIIAYDKPESLSLRQEMRAAHLAYVAETGIVQIAGPFLDEKGDMCGSLVILDTETRKQAERWAEGDPYARAGLFERVEIRAWKKVIG